MSRTVLGIIGAISGLVIVALAAPNLSIGVLACGAAAGLLWLCSQCRHRDPLGLLPPVVLHDGTRLPARWFCSSCGRTWPAGFKHDSTPVVRYAGFDQTKAEAAARRASELEKKMQALAVRRAGTRGSRQASARPAPAPGVPPTIVSIQNGRRAATK